MSYYGTLYISKASSNAEIKMQYQKLAFDFHPDRRNGDKSMYLDIRKAYEILSNKYTRSFYDSFGESGLEMCADQTLMAMYTRLFSLWALHLLVIAGLCFEIGLILFPVFLFMMYREIFINSFTFCHLQFMLFVIILGFYVARCYVLIRKYEENEFKQIKLFMIAVFGKLSMVILQICFGYIIEDNFITKSTFVYVFPYAILEIIILIEDYIYIQENREEFDVKNMY
ncbi:DnaJ subfamily C member 16 [Conglomerata obtusa]